MRWLFKVSDSVVVPGNVRVNGVLNVLVGGSHLNNGVVIKMTVDGPMDAIGATC